MFCTQPPPVWPRTCTLTAWCRFEADRSTGTLAGRLLLACAGPIQGVRRLLRDCRPSGTAQQGCWDCCDSLRPRPEALLDMCSCAMLDSCVACVSQCEAALGPSCGLFAGLSCTCQPGFNKGVYYQHRARSLGGDTNDILKGSRGLCRVLFATSGSS